MNWYTAVKENSHASPVSADGTGVLVCDNPIQCWEYVPSTTHKEIWSVLPYGPVETDKEGRGRASGVVFLKKLETWQLAAYSNARYACVTEGQKIVSGGRQKIFAFKTGTVYARDNCHVTAQDSVYVMAEGSVVVEGRDRVKASLLDESRCYAQGVMQVTLIGRHSSVTFPKQASVKVTLIEGNPKNVLSDGRFFTADSHKRWLKEKEEEIARYRDDSFWDTNPLEGPQDVFPETGNGDGSQSRAQRGRAGLAALFGETA